MDTKPLGTLTELSDSENDDAEQKLLSTLSSRLSTLQAGFSASYQFLIKQFAAQSAEIENIRKFLDEESVTLQKKRLKKAKEKIKKRLTRVSLGGAIGDSVGGLYFAEKDAGIGVRTTIANASVGSTQASQNGVIFESTFPQSKGSLKRKADAIAGAVVHSEAQDLKQQLQPKFDNRRATAGKTNIPPKPLLSKLHVTATAPAAWDVLNIREEDSPLPVESLLSPGLPTAARPTSPLPSRAPANPSTSPAREESSSRSKLCPIQSKKDTFKPASAPIQYARRGRRGGGSRGGSRGGRGKSTITCTAPSNDNTAKDIPTFNTDEVDAFPLSQLGPAENSIVKRAPPIPITDPTTEVKERIDSLPALASHFKIPQRLAYFDFFFIRKYLGGKQGQGVARVGSESRQTQLFKCDAYIALDAEHHHFIPQYPGKHGAMLDVSTIEAADVNPSHSYPLFVRSAEQNNKWCYFGEYVVVAHREVPVSVWKMFPEGLRRYWAKRIRGTLWGKNLMRDQNLIPEANEEGFLNVSVDQVMKLFEMEPDKKLCDNNSLQALRMSWCLLQCVAWNQENYGLLVEKLEEEQEEDEAKDLDEDDINHSKNYRIDNYDNNTRNRDSPQVKHEDNKSLEIFGKPKQTDQVNGTKGRPEVVSLLEDDEEDEQYIYRDGNETAKKQKRIIKMQSRRTSGRNLGDRPNYWDDGEAGDDE